MLHDLIQLRRGREKVVMTDELSKVNDRMKTLRKSQRKGIRGEKVLYSVRQTSSREKYKEKPHNVPEHGI